MFSNGRNSSQNHKGNQAQIMSGFDLSEHCSVCSLILENYNILWCYCLRFSFVKPSTYGGFVIRDLKLGLQVVSKPPELLVLFGRAFYHHRPQKFQVDLTLCGGMAETHFMGFGSTA